MRLDELDDPDTLLVGEDPTPGTDLSGRTVKRQQLDELMARAMSGLLPRSRSLKSWEPDVLDERHLQAICMRASGLQQGFIAQQMGWTESWTSIVLNHPDAQYILTKMISYAADEVLDVHARIKAHAGEALDKVVEVMRTTTDQRLASNNAFELLRMAGYAAPEKVEHKHQIQMPAQQVDLLSEAIRESRQIAAVAGVDYRIVPNSAPGNVGSVAPAAHGDSGSGGASSPPTGDSQAAEVQHDGTRVRVA